MPYCRNLGMTLWEVRSDLAKGKKGKLGSSFDEFLSEVGILEECEDQAIKQILADQIKAAMEKNSIPRRPWQ